MIEKKIRYDINIEKPSTTKPVKQGGVLNYLGKQKTVNAPVKWRSSKDHPIAHLAYITKDEEKILVDLNLYGSLKGKPNKGPSGIISLNGGGGGSSGDSGGDSGGASDSGPGGSDEGSGHGGPGPGGGQEGSSLGDANDQGGTAGPGPGPGANDGGYDGFGIGPNAEAEAAASNAAAAAAAAKAAEVEVDMSMPALQTMQEKAMTQVENTFSVPGMIGGLVGMNFGVPFSIGATIGSNIGRGVTAPDDFSQLDTSVQNGPAKDSSGGDGILNIYAPLTNPTSGDNTVDAMRTRLNALLDVKPTVYGIPAAVNKLSNYSLLDLSNLRK